jgi:hypothetical protein
MALEDRCLPAVTLTPGANIDVSAMSGNEAEESITIDPTNSTRLFVAAVQASAFGSNAGQGEPGLVASFSTNSGKTWDTRLMARGGPNDDGLPSGIADPSAAFDKYGNLFLAYQTGTTMQYGACSEAAAKNTVLIDKGRSTKWSNDEFALSGNTRDISPLKRSQGEPIRWGATE